MVSAVRLPFRWRVFWFIQSAERHAEIGRCKIGVAKSIDLEIRKPGKHIQARRHPDHVDRLSIFCSAKYRNRSALNSEISSEVTVVSGRCTKNRNV